MMKGSDQSVEINNNPNWSYILDHPDRISIVGDSGSGKTYVLLNLINYEISSKFIYISKIHSNQSINGLLMEEKK